MPSQEVLRSFLVSLDFTLNESKLAKFEQGLAKATTTVLKFGAEWSAVVVGLAIGVERFAANMESLFYESQRVGSSATAIKAYELAIRNMGGTASDAQASVEGLASAIRHNPTGIGGMLSGLFAQWAPDQKFDPKDTVHDLLALSEVFQHMVATLGQAQGTQLALQYASMLNLPDNDVLAMLKPGFAQQFQAAQKLAQNNGFDKAAADAHKFMIQVRDLGLQLEVFGTQVLDAIQTKFGVSLQTLNDWLTKNGPAMAARLAAFAGSATDFFLRLTNGILSFLAAMGKLENSPAIKLLDRFNTATNPTAIEHDAHSVKSTVTGWWDDLKFSYNKLPNTIKYLMGMGMSPAAASGIAANLVDESRLDPNQSGDHGKAYGIAQWHAPYWDEFKKLFGHDIHGSTLDEQLQFLGFTLSQNAGLEHRLNGATPYAAAAIFSQQYERPAAGATAAAARGALAVNVYNDVTVHIDGSQDPTATGHAAKAALQGITSNATRNLIGAAAQ